jgi:anti-anti-sigma factor
MHDGARFGHVLERVGWRLESADACPIVSGMEMSEEKIGDVKVVRLRGRLDAAAAPVWKSRGKTLVKAGDRKIVLDCLGLTFVDSSGLTAFIASRNELYERRNAGDRRSQRLRSVVVRNGRRRGRVHNLQDERGRLRQLSAVG